MTKLYTAKTIVRWSDLDANRHLANASYMNFTSYARIAFLRDFGITMETLAHHEIGPAVLHEDFSFFREAHEGEEIYITIEIGGMSDDGMIFNFKQNLYRKDGTHLCSSDLTGVWFSMTDRKMKIPPTEITEKIKKSFEGQTVKVLTKMDLMRLPKRAQNIDPSLFNI
ncbi:MAG: acyl-CoA thioesterase [Weeksellaceae bacterium]|nr:acyl-CoA thioesterase [Weeksellaceae bacterium]